jgi:phosphoglycerate dehydrogenase-like enzyme
MHYRNRLILLPLLALLLQSPAAVAAEPGGMLAGLGLRESAVASRDLAGYAPLQKVVVRSLFGSDAAAPLKAVAPGVEIVAVATVEEAVAAVPGAQALIGFCDQAIFEAADELHWVQVYFAGVENCVSQPAMAGGGLVLSNGQRLSSPTIAEHTMAMTYSLVRGLDVYHGQQTERRWAPNTVPSLLEFGGLENRTMLVVGLGGIGSQVARRAHALGMRVVATRNSSRSGPDYVDYVGLADELLKLAAEADVVVNAAPLTPSTEGLFDADFFKAMKPGAYFVSVGRGRSTVTADLIAALESGAIAGAALDVTDPEPLPADHPLWQAPRLLITPHMSAMSAATVQRIGALVVENLRRYQAGEPLLSVVDIERGY